MTKATVFKSNQAQAVRLPKAVAFPDGVKTVEIVKVGHSRLIVPSDALWDDWFEGAGVSDDFMTERTQPESQARESF